MDIVVLYYYAFYKFYSLFEAFSQTRWLTTAKAAICLGSLELGLYFSIINYRDVLLKHSSDFEYNTFIVVLVIITFKMVCIFPG